MSCNFCEIANGYVDQESFRTLMLKMMKSLVDAETSESSSSQTLPLSDNNNGVVTYFLRTYVRDYQGNLINTIDTTLDGSTPYTATGTVGLAAVNAILMED